MAEQIWSFNFALPCALLMITLLAFYFSRPRLPIRTNIAFLGLLALQLLVMVFDVASSLADEHFRQFSPESLYVLNTLYFMFYLARVGCFYGFTLEVMEIFNKPLIALSLVPLAIGEVLAISSFATGALFTIDEGYHSGPYYNMLYVCSYFYVILAVFLLAVNSKHLKEGAFATTIAFNLVLLVGNVVRYLLPHLLVMNTFCMVAIVVIYLAFMNPDLYLSDDRRAYNMHGFHTLVRDWAGRKDYQMLGFVLRNYNYERSIMGGRQMDQAVSEISDYLRKTFPRSLPFYLRTGRFALIGPSSADWEAARQTISRRFSHPWDVGDASLTFGVTFAHVSSSVERGDAEGIGDSFLIALEESRDAVSGSYSATTIFAEDTSLLDKRVEALRVLEQAIENEQVEVFLQPLFDSETNSMVAAEALARLRDDEGNIISPELFIPIAEKSGYIGILGDQVLKKVCIFVRSHDMDALGLRWINVNLSPLQCMQPDIAEHFLEILETYDVDPDMIHLEITEESMVDYLLLERQMMALKRKGFQFALDDYGSGYSNLTRVKHYPFVNIKIDREVVWDYCRERDSLLPAIVRSFRDMGLSVTAEGIETEEMARCVIEMGCNYLQGFLYSRPLPMDVFVKRYG